LDSSLLIVLGLVVVIIILILILFVIQLKYKKNLQKMENFALQLEAFNALNLPLFYKDNTGKFIGFNKIFDKSFGDQKRETLQELASYTGNINTEVTLIFDNGIKKDVLLVQTNFLDSQKNLLGTVGYIQDIHNEKREKKSIVEKKTLLQNALDFSDEGYFEWEIQTDKATYSPTWKKLMGYTLEDDEPNNLSGWLNLVESLDIAQVNEKVRNFLDSKTQTLDVEHRVKAFSQDHWVKIKAKAIKDAQNQPLKVIGTIRNITRTKLLQQELQEQKNLLTSFIENLPFLSFIKDKNGKYLYINNFYHKYLGYKEWKGKHISELFEESIAKRIEESDREAFYEAIHEHQEIIPDNKGANRLFETYKFPVELKEQEVLCGIGIDITQKVALQEEILLYKEVLDATKSSVIVLDKQRKILHVNKVFEQVTGFKKFELLNTPISIRNSNKHDEKFYDALWKEVLSNGEWRGKLYTKNKDKTDTLEITNIYATYDSKNSVKNFFILSQGLQREKFVQNSINQSLDPLTNLPNKIAFHQLLDQAIFKAQQHQDIFALVYVNIDDFKLLNNSLGQEGGDEALKEVAKKLSYHIRQNDTLARLQGDEFCIILENITAIKDITIVCERILEEMTKPIKLKNIHEILSVSIGVSIFPNHSTDAKKLLDFAHLAMYKAKREGKNVYTIYKA
jgi:diguanylate cyclase (GGDEF)-like protein/PAS domain S-box-containing protein